MGRSQTIHCLGVCKDNNGKSRVYYAMNRLEIMQVTKKAKEHDGEILEYWYSQTKTGDRILGKRGVAFAHEIPEANNVVVCEVCNGKGCYICNNSGITYKGHYKNWQQWQIDNVKKVLHI